MIALDNVSILKPGLFHREPILLDAKVKFEIGERVGILAAPGTGKTSIAKMLAGIDSPDSGTVRTTGRVSWPIGFAGFLHPKLSVRDNLGIFARMTGVSEGEVIGFCEDFCGFDVLGTGLMEQLTPTQRAILAFACALSVPGPAMWIADEVISVGEARERRLCDEVLSRRLETGGLVFISRNVRQLKLSCDRWLVLINKRLVPCQDLEIAKEALELEMADSRMVS